MVNGRSATASEDNAAEAGGSGPWFTVETVAPVAGTSAGGGITDVTIFRGKPQITKDSVSITYSDTEFEFAAATLLDFDETEVRFGAHISTWPLYRGHESDRTQRRR